MQSAYTRAVEHMRNRRLTMRSYICMVHRSRRCIELRASITVLYVLSIHTVGDQPFLLHDVVRSWRGHGLSVNTTQWIQYKYRFDQTAKDT